ncbi:ArnT family glycosyltransferase [Actinomadura harenae]|uniref:ArnT family glycosyltransferase n=1 Tax=Actinomadura harenae TaxID=2483351 RepID=UPI00131593A1|nr:phospholipid carrier-dependent glycosyltransferase [Actinomadura harenae]
MTRQAHLVDELVYVTAGWRYLHGRQLPMGPAVTFTVDNFEHPPLAKYLFGIAQVIAGHPSLTAARLVAVLCTLATGVVLGCWIGGVAGRWTGLLAGALVTLVPTHIPGVAYRFGRYAMLDPVAELLATGAMAAGWFWFQHRGRPGWRWAAGTGVLTGLAAGAKANGFLGLVGPVLLGLVLVLRERRELMTRLAQTAVACAVSALTFVALYLPLGDPVPRIRFMLEFQTKHAEDGHLIGFAGRVTAHPPWWTNLWFAGHGLGPVVVGVLAIGWVSALILRRDRLVGWCAAALVAPVLFHCFLARVTLGFYWAMWLPPTIALAALGLAALAQRVRAVRRGVRPAVVVLLAGALTWTAGLAAADTWRTLHARPAGTTYLPKVMALHNLRGAVLAGGIYGWEFTGVHLPGAVHYQVPADLSRVDTVVIGRPRCRTPVAADVRAFLAANQGSLRQAYRDHLIVVYAVQARLRAPTTTEIAAQPPWNLAAFC